MAASMGPCFESTEYQILLYDRDADSLLQWGRALKARNTVPLGTDLTMLIKLQWGRALKARNTKIGAIAASRKGGFNGAVL